MSEVRVGAMFRCSAEPEVLLPFARRIEELGYDELWIVEDCFYAGGIASATAALAATERIVVGLGILPAVMRNPAATAMELAALAAGLVVGVAFTRRQHALADPLLDLGLFANRSFSITLGSMLAYSMLSGGTGGSRPEHVAVVGEAHQRRLPCGQG